MQIVPTVFARAAQGDDSAVVLLIGCGLFAILLVGIAAASLVLGGRPQADIDQPVAKRDERTKDAALDERPKIKAKAGREPVREPSEVKTIGAPDTKPSEILPPAKETPPVLAPSLALAPAPHPVPLNRPPDGFTSEWVRCVEIETRVVGVAVRRPILTSNGNEFPSLEPLLLVWVETRSLPTARKVLRRWLTTVDNDVELADAANNKVGVAKIPSSAWLGGQLKGDHVLPPGGPGVVDILAFDVPFPARNLWLKLAGSHVGQPGVFLHKIPVEVWSKK